MPEMSKGQQPSDRQEWNWTKIEQAALTAFASYALPPSPGLAATLKQAVRYARIDNAAKEIVISRRAFMFGLVSVGLLDTPSAAAGNSANWLAAWLQQRVSGLADKIRSGLTGTDALLNAFARGYAVKASISMSGVGVLAMRYAEQTVSRNRADLRHFAAALLTDSSKAKHNLLELAGTSLDQDITAMRAELYRGVSTTPEAKENLEQWRAILLKGSVPEKEKIDPETSEVPGFDADRPRLLGEDGDPLELLADVKAFSQLICLAGATPPLSIGLFGGWGSGKSTFMHLLEAEIDNLTEKTRNAKPPSDAAARSGTHFVRNIVQVRFNAWHFADANLWASLTAEFFDQLRAGGYSRSGKAIHKKLVERVNAHVHALTSEAAAARQALAASEEQLRKAQYERDLAISKAKELPGAALRQTIVDAVTKSFEASKRLLAEIGQKTDVNDPKKDIEDFLTTAKAVQDFSGQARYLVKFVGTSGWRIGLLLAGFAAFAFGIAMFPIASWLDLTASSLLALAPSGLLALLGGLAAIARVILPGIKTISALAKNTAEFATELDSEIEKSIKDIAEKEEILNRQAAEITAQRAAADRAAKALARYVDPAAQAANPPRLLRFLLEDDPDTRLLEKEIGLISRVRRLFQAVDEIVREEKDSQSDDDVPDRIVIYIDDLDRCTPPQVYAVLQAIHLLLAFELFVVVVGVDVAWIEESLARELRPAVLNGIDSGQRIDERKLAIRYMEKIFQLPFWLRRLTPAGTDGGSYGRFVRSLVARNIAAPEARKSAQRDSGEPAKPIEPQVDAIAPSAVEDPFPPDTIETALAMISLTDAEIGFLTSSAIGAIAGTEPRTVKRFINIYRIIRARLNPVERQAFLGETAEFPIAIILAAVETGQPLEVAEAFHRRVRALKTGKPVEAIAGIPGGIASAFIAARKLRNGKPAGAKDCARWAETIRRYSFNPYD